MDRTRQYLTQGLEFLALAMAVLAALAMIGIVGIIVASVIMRRFANTPLHITEDVVGLMLSVVLFLALPYVTLHSKHVRVSIVLEAAGKRFRPWLVTAAMIVGIIFFGWIFIESLPWFEFAWKRGLKTETARILLYPWMAVLPVSIGLTFMIFLFRLFGLIGAENHSPAEEATPVFASGKED